MAEKRRYVEGAEDGEGDARCEQKGVAQDNTDPCSRANCDTELFGGEQTTPIERPTKPEGLPKHREEEHGIQPDGMPTQKRRCVFVGPTGSGKSTIINLLSSIFPPICTPRGEGFACVGFDTDPSFPGGMLKAFLHGQIGGDPAQARRNYQDLKTDKWWTRSSPEAITMHRADVVLVVVRAESILSHSHKELLEEVRGFRPIIVVSQVEGRRRELLEEATRAFEAPKNRVVLVSSLREKDLSGHEATAALSSKISAVLKGEEPGEEDWISDEAPKRTCASEKIALPAPHTPVQCHSGPRTQQLRRRRRGRKHWPQSPPSWVEEANRKLAEQARHCSPNGNLLKELGCFNSPPVAKESLAAQSDFLYQIAVGVHDIDPEAHLCVEVWKHRLLSTMRKTPSSIKAIAGASVAGQLSAIGAGKGGRRVGFAAEEAPGQGANYTLPSFPDEVDSCISDYGPWILHSGLGIEGLLTFMLQIAMEHKACSESDITLPTFDDIYALLGDSSQGAEVGRSEFVTSLQEVVKSRVLDYFRDSAGNGGSDCQPFYFQLGIELKNDEHRDRAGRLAGVDLHPADRPHNSDHVSPQKIQAFEPPEFGVMVSRVVAALLVANGAPLGLGGAIEVRTTNITGEVRDTCPPIDRPHPSPMGQVDVFCCSQRNAQLDAPAPPPNSASYGFLWGVVPSTRERMEGRLAQSTTYSHCIVKDGFPQLETTPAYFRPETRRVECVSVAVVSTKEDPKTRVSTTVQAACKDSNLVAYITEPRLGRDRRPMFVSKVAFKQPPLRNGGARELVVVDPWDPELYPSREPCPTKRDAENLAAEHFLDWLQKQPRFQAEAPCELRELDALMTQLGGRGWQVHLSHSHVRAARGEGRGTYHTHLAIVNNRGLKELEADTAKISAVEGGVYRDVRLSEERAVKEAIGILTQRLRMQESRPEKMLIKPLSTPSVAEVRKQLAQMGTKMPIKTIGALKEPIYRKAEVRHTDTYPTPLTQHPYQ